MHPHNPPTLWAGPVFFAAVCFMFFRGVILDMRSLVRAISAMWSLSAEIATNYNRVLLPLPCFYQHSSRRRFLA